MANPFTASWKETPSSSTVMMYSSTNQVSAQNTKKTSHFCHQNSNHQRASSLTTHHSRNRKRECRKRETQRRLPLQWILARSQFQKNRDVHTKPGPVLRIETEAISQGPRNHRGHELPPTQPYQVSINQQQEDIGENTQEQENRSNRSQSSQITTERPQDAPST